MNKLSISLFFGLFIFAVLILYLIRIKRLSLRYSIVWLMVSFVLIVIAMFQDTFSKVSSFLGFLTPSNAIIIIIIFFQFILILFLTSIVSTQNDRIKRIVQKIALLENKLLSSKGDEKKS